MPSYKILGIYSFTENIKKLNLNDKVLLKKENKNIKSDNAIGVYNLENKKLGYLPVEKNEELLNHKNSYKISTLLLHLQNPIVEISRDYDNIKTFEDIEYPIIKELKYDLKIIHISDEINKSIEMLFLKIKKLKIKNIGITYMDENYTNIFFQTKNDIVILYTITYKYFINNKDYYEELYDFNLIENPFYKEFYFHRIETYYEKNYKNVETINENHDEYNFIKKNIHTKLITINNSMIINDNFWYLYFKYLIDNEDIYIIKYINKLTKNNFNSVEDILNYYFKNSEEIINFISLFDDIELGKFTINHDLQIYGYINFVNEKYLIEITNDNNNSIINKARLCKKNNIIIYNPLLGNIFYLENI
jgi:hypothetical protein